MKPPRYLIPYAVMVVALGLSGLAWYYTEVTTARTAQTRFQNASASAVTWLEQRMARHISALEGVRALFTASQDVEPEEFTAYIRAIRPAAQFSGLAAIQYVPRVAQQDLPAFNQRLRQRGLDTPVWDLVAGRGKPPRISAEYFPIEHIEPFQRQAQALDVSSDPSNQVAMALARDRGEAVLGKRIAELVEGPAGQPAFLAFVPIYQNRMPVADAAQRRVALQGYAVGVFSSPPFFGNVFGRQILKDLHYAVYDGDRLAPQYLLYSSPTPAREDPGALHLRKTLRVAGRSWTLVVTAGPNFQNPLDRHLPVWVLAGGVSISFLLFIVALLQQRGRELAERHAARLQASHVALNSIADAIITTDAMGCITYLNPAAQYLTGWEERRAIGEPLMRVFSAVHALSHKPVDCPAERCLRENRVFVNTEHNVLLLTADREFPIESAVAPIHAQDGQVTGVVLTFRDVSQSYMLTQKIAYQASHDELTGLPNRRHFDADLRRALESARLDGHEHALCYLDLDQFKVVNDTCGHAAGDLLLRQLAGRLQQIIREHDVLARLGGDEFGVLLNNCPLEKAWDIAQALRTVVKDFRFVWEGKVFDVGVSIGMVPLTTDSEGLTEILSAADSACYVAKDRGRNRVHVYRQNDAALTQRQGEMQWLTRIREGLDQQRFCLYLQPMRSIHGTASGNHCEVLLRLKDETGALILPGAFIPAAERYHLMPELDRWVVGTALAALKQHHAMGGEMAGVCAINLSGQSLCEEGFPHFVLDAIRKEGLDPRQICFEITETAVIGNLDQATRFIALLKDAGCRFALDDFGSGLSSFAYLKSLSVDYLKIDGGFVRRMLEDRMDYAIVETINQIGHTMGMQTIAEFVENEAILEALAQIGVDFAQGYGVGRPRPVEQGFGPG